MRSRDAVVAAILLTAGAAGAEPAGSASADAVQQAAAQVRAHPDMPGTKLQKYLTLRNHDKSPTKPPKKEGSWWADFARWIAEAGRWLIWLLGAAAVAGLLVGLRRWIQVRGALGELRGVAGPSHVQSLDIRPESLPGAIGATALANWQEGRHRAALSLLYRGALSRLVHVHGVPIRGASTEGECVALARSHVDGARGEFFAQLVVAWQIAVYGGRQPDAGAVEKLCRAFDATWPPAVEVPA